MSPVMLFWKLMYWAVVILYGLVILTVAFIVALAFLFAFRAAVLWLERKIKRGDRG